MAAVLVAGASAFVGPSVHIRLRTKTNCVEATSPTRTSPLVLRSSSNDEDASGLAKVTRVENLRTNAKELLMNARDPEKLAGVKTQVLSGGEDCAREFEERRRERRDELRRDILLEGLLSIVSNVHQPNVPSLSQPL